MNKPLYLDSHSTTPVDPQVLEAMLPYFTEEYGNAASKSHIYGVNAFQAVETGREIIAKSINAKSQEIIFTSGATEAINLAIKGLAFKNKEKKHFITIKTEHKAVLDCYEWIQSLGHEITLIDVNAFGEIDLEKLSLNIQENTILVSVMHANNETGIIHPIKKIGEICRENGVFFFTDATQTMGKEHLDVESMKIDMLACSAHKLNGPKGIGVLYVRRSRPRIKLDAIIHGGGHEKGLRSGTLNVPGIVGFAEAIRILSKDREKKQVQLREIRDTFWNEIKTNIPTAQLNGKLENRLAANLNISFQGVESEALIIALKNDVAVSSGSACTSDAVYPSHVLKAMGFDEDRIYSSIRFGIDNVNHNEETGKKIITISEQFNRLNF